MSNKAGNLKLAYTALENELSFSCAGTTENAWLEACVKRLNDLISNDFNRLVQVLYRLDVSESKLKSLLEDSSQAKTTGAAEIICKLIIERQIQKIKTKEAYRRDEDISEEEKW
ncbi:MAG: hypothetical protein WKF89_01480 [Chitinophagaceae bacterium]